MGAIRYNEGTMRHSINTTTLWRPTGENELRLIRDSDMRRFPPRLPEQPIFYPVLNFEYAEQIARDWNSTDARHDHVGYVTEFDILTVYLAEYKPHQVGSRLNLEYWIPAHDLPRFNDSIIGETRIVAEYRRGARLTAE